MALPLDLTIRASNALDHGEREAIIRLCSATFAEDFSTLFTSAPPTVIHLRATHHGRLVGHACWWPRRFQTVGSPELHAAYVKLVAVAPAWQRQGIGSTLMRRFADETADYRLRALSTVRPAFYERLGWRRWRGPFAIPSGAGTPEHPSNSLMILPTRHTPPLDFDDPLIAERSNGGHW